VLDLFLDLFEFFHLLLLLVYPVKLRSVLLPANSPTCIPIVTGIIVFFLFPLRVFFWLPEQHLFLVFACRLVLQLSKSLIGLGKHLVLMLHLIILYLMSVNLLSQG
jgi:hypothetical protein